jgi:hypothetical protein
MTKYAGKQTKVYVDEFNFSGKTNQAEISIDIDLPDYTAFEDAAAEVIEGGYHSGLSLNGFFDPAASGYDQEMWEAFGSDASHLIGVYPGNLAVHGSVGYEIEGKNESQKRPLEVAGAILLNVQWKADGPVVRTKVLCNGAVTGTGAVTNSNKNLGATVAGEQFVGILRVLSVSGAGSITVKIQQSQNDGDPDAYADLFTFDAKTAIGSQRMSTILATEAWKRVNVSAFSGFTSVTILVVAGKAA